MVYKLRAALRFSTAAARNAAVTSVNASASGRGLPSAEAIQAPTGPALGYTAESGSAVDIQAVYAVISGLTTPLARSHADWHACYHGELAQVCPLLGEKVW